MEGRRCLESLKDTPHLGRLNSDELSYRWVDTMFNAAALRVEGMKGCWRNLRSMIWRILRGRQDRKSGAKDFRDEIDIAINELQQRAQKYESEGPDEDKKGPRCRESFQNLKTDIQKYEGLLDAHLNEVHTLATVHPLSVKELRKNGTSSTRQRSSPSTRRSPPGGRKITPIRRLAG